MERAGDVSFDYQDGNQLWKKLDSAAPLHKDLAVSSLEAFWIASALEATFRELDWDYQTRTGVTVMEAQAL